MTDSQPVSARIAARLLRTRWIVRAPIWIYRSRLGIIFGRRLLMLEHVGRKTGRRRYVVLEVVDRGPDRYVVAAGFGENAQWLRNIDANPQVRVSVGTRVSAAATARRLSPAETAAALRSYAQRYPRAWKHLTPVFESTLGTRIDANGTTLPMVSLEL